MKQYPTAAELQTIIQLLQQHRLDAALEHCSRLCDEYPSDARIWFYMGIISGQRDEYDRCVSSLQRSIELNPAYDQSHHYLGTAFLRKGELDKAIASYKTAIRLNPRNVDPYTCICNILAARKQFEEALPIARAGITSCPSSAQLHCEAAKILNELGRSAEAIGLLQTACTLDPESMEARYFLAALSGEHSKSSGNQSHVTQMFDGAAETFDRHLVQGLKYQVPDHLYECVCRYIHDFPAKLDILDLGCGTGLAGEIFRPISRTLTGVDLSPKMIEKARERGIYHDLSAAELTRYLAQSSAEYDLVLATDVFIYVGDLDKVFRNSLRVLKSGGLFAFSVESAPGSSFKMQASGRYAHSTAYIEELALQYTLELQESREITVREECFQPVPGRIFVFRRRD